MVWVLAGSRVARRSRMPLRGRFVRAGAIARGFPTKSFRTFAVEQLESSPRAGITSSRAGTGGSLWTVDPPRAAPILVVAIERQDPCPRYENAPH